MNDKGVVKMEGAQALSLVSIHPTQCGMYYYKVKQLQSWAAYWDGLCEISHNKEAIIGCTAGLSGVSDAKDYVESLMAHILDGSREFELIVEAQKFVIRKVYGDKPGFKVDHWIHNSHDWIKQCRYGYLIHGSPIALFEILFEPMLSDNWQLPSEYTNY